MKHKDPSFSIYEFKYWLEKQPNSELKFPGGFIPHTDNKSVEGIGIKVESRLGIQRLEEQIVKFNEDLEHPIEIAKNFKENGGKVVEQRANLTVLVETSLGSFVIPKMYTKPASG